MSTTMKDIEEAFEKSGPVSLLDVMDEQLADSLFQQELAASGRVEGSVATTSKDGPVLSSSPTLQGSWGRGGSSAADILRASAVQPEVSTAEVDDVEVPIDPGALAAMVSMGIEESRASAALMQCGGSDTARAVEWCFAQPDALPDEGETEGGNGDHGLKTQQGSSDEDMALALAIHEEEKRTLQERWQRGAEAGISSSGSKISIGYATAIPRSSSSTEVKRWSSADMGDDDYKEGLGDGGVGEAEGIPGGGDSEDSLEVIPGRGRNRRKGASLFLNSKGDVVSKHDSEICGRMNAKVASGMEGVGELAVNNVRLNNRTFNSLKKDIRKKTLKGITATGRVEGEVRATQEGVMDPSTRMTVLKMINAGHLFEVHGNVKTGKEAHVYHASAPKLLPGAEALGMEGVGVGVGGGERGVALKIFKTTLNEFGNRAAYVDGDPRYGNIRFKKQSRQKMFVTWAKKEHRNLIRVHRSGIPCPEPILQREHVLLMSFIGKEHWPAPQLRELDLSAANWVRCYVQVLELARGMYRRCRLVHGDLSEYNVLYHNKVCHVIDLGQAVDIGHPKALELLRRDLEVVTDFSRRKGVANLLPIPLAEVFVTKYLGPFDFPSSTSTEVKTSRSNDQPSTQTLPMGGGGDGAGSEKERDSDLPTGQGLLTSLMDASAEGIESMLLVACEASNKFAASRRARRSRVGHGVKAEEEEGGLNKEAEEDEDGELEWENVDDEDEDEDEEEEEEEEEGGGGGGSGGGSTEANGSGVGGASSTNGSSLKIELGERERARMADVKELLKAGLTVPPGI